MYGSEYDLGLEEPTAWSALQDARHRHAMLGMLVPGGMGSCLQGLGPRVCCLCITMSAVLNAPGCEG